MKRAIALSLIMLLTIGLMLPLVPTEASNKAKSHYSRKKNKKIKKYSKAWWRRYRARMKKKRALLARKRALRAKRAQYAKANKAHDASKTATTKPEMKSPTTQQPVTASFAGGYYDSRAGWSVTVPAGWTNRPSQEGNDSTFKLYSNGRTPAGSATISVVGSAAPQANDSGKAQPKTLGGVSVAIFRRMVIDKMIREEGWVVNDYVKEIGGKRVFVVVAQTPATNGQAAQTKVFYFTESGGRIMSVSTSSTADTAERVASDSEKVIESLSKNSTGSSVGQSASINK